MKEVTVITLPEARDLAAHWPELFRTGQILDRLKRRLVGIDPNILSDLAIESVREEIMIANYALDDATQHLLSVLPPIRRAP